MGDWHHLEHPNMVLSRNSDLTAFAKQARAQNKKPSCIWLGRSLRGLYFSAKLFLLRDLVRNLPLFTNLFDKFGRTKSPRLFHLWLSPLRSSLCIASDPPSLLFSRHKSTCIGFDLADTCSSGISPGRSNMFLSRQDANHINGARMRLMYH